ncbi:hypothetical protein [Polynucleobacter sp. AP-Kolm-20A-A1]|uniref:hypothetical protein n=1 Tax=Polynucleobacter sp. AP-Kolm-20A-A1 TaxID=2081041 RepID=UPI001BFEAE6E|nr:hypothetical protein [Polynucleobacter sp. AP-Kolm-20A-A1]QWE19922.1 hypothetical protein C2745_05820 [Polynucleobacter sp. AP-Kolm-20A-A1]
MKIILAALVLFSGFAYGGPSDDEITKEIIKESIANYKGICPCPYSTHPDGRQCGYRSAYSSKSASAPICYSITVTPSMVEDYKKRHKL